MIFKPCSLNHKINKNKNIILIDIDQSLSFELKCMFLVDILVFFNSENIKLFDKYHKSI